MAALAGKKYVGAEYQKSYEIVRVTYDFDVDTGAQADYDVLEAAGACVVKFLHCHVKTAGAGTNNVNDLGKAAGGTEFWSNQAVTAMTTDAMLTCDAVAGFAGVELTAGEKIVFGVETANLTAGKFEFVFAIMAR